MRVARGQREAHLGIIGSRNGTHAKYIADRAFREDNEDGFRPMIRKIADITNVNLAVKAQEKFVEHLVDIDEIPVGLFLRSWSKVRELNSTACLMFL